MTLDGISDAAVAGDVEAINIAHIAPVNVGRRWTGRGPLDYTRKARIKILIDQSGLVHVLDCVQ